MKGVEKKYTTKKCYNCLTHLPMDAVVCQACKKKVGKVNDNGIAAKPFDWKAYLAFLIALAALIGFIWKVFIDSGA